MNLNEKELLEIYDLVFTSVHSIGFKTAEIKTLLFDKDYWFMERPKENWKVDTMNYLDSIGFDKTLLNINTSL